VSDLLAAAAAALKAPEVLVQRSAEARAKATGAAVDEILAAWAGGDTAPSAPPAAEPSTQPAAPAEPEPSPPPPAPGPQPEAPPAAEPSPQPPAPGPLPEQPAATPRLEEQRPPVLVGERQSLAGIVWGAIGLLFLSLLLGFLLPSTAGVVNQVRSSAQPHTESGLAGADVYRSEGCGSCHTQLVRPVVGDFELGPVTLADSNQVLGYRRVGPDLSTVGLRLDESSLRSVLSGTTLHPNTPVSDAALDNLIAYLLESR
jgi:hypothetical protein